MTGSCEWHKKLLLLLVDPVGLEATAIGPLAGGNTLEWIGVITFIYWASLYRGLLEKCAVMSWPAWEHTRACTPFAHYRKVTIEQLDGFKIEYARNIGLANS